MHLNIVVFTMVGVLRGSIELVDKGGITSFHANGPGSVEMEHSLSGPVNRHRVGSAEVDHEGLEGIVEQIIIRISARLGSVQQAPVLEALDLVHHLLVHGGGGDVDGGLVLASGGVGAVLSPVSTTLGVVNGKSREGRFLVDSENSSCNEGRRDVGEHIKKK